MSMNNTPAQLYLFNVSSYIQLGSSSKVGCGFVLAAYDEEDARDEVREFIGDGHHPGIEDDLEFEAVLFLGLASDESEHGMIMHHIPDFI